MVFLEVAYIMLIVSVVYFNTQRRCSPRPTRLYSSVGGARLSAIFLVSDLAQDIQV